MHANIICKIALKLVNVNVIRFKFFGLIFIFIAIIIMPYITFQQIRVKSYYKFFCAHIITKRSTTLELASL